NGIQQFLFGQLKNIGRAAFSNTITDLVTGQPLTQNSVFAGTLLADPLKDATHLNTLATVDNTNALRALAVSRTGGGGGLVSGGRGVLALPASGSGGIYTSGTSSDTGYTSDGLPRYSPENYDADGNFLGAGATSSYDPSAVGEYSRTATANPGF